MLLYLLDEEDVLLALRSGFKLVDDIIRANKGDLELEVYRTKARIGYDKFRIVNNLLI